MNLHRNARTTPISRAEMARRVLGGQSPMAVATAMGIDVKTVRKWAGRFQTEGPAVLEDRSSRPHKLRRPTQPGVVDQVILLRRSPPRPSARNP